MERLVWYDTVQSVRKRTIIRSGALDAKGDAVFKTEVDGWYIQCGYFSYYYGSDEPKQFKQGDRVKFTLEKVNDLTDSRLAPV